MTAQTRAPYRPGDRVGGLILVNGAGTCLATGTVAHVEPHERQPNRWTIRVSFAIGGAASEARYVVDREGRSDYVGPLSDFPSINDSPKA